MRERKRPIPFRTGPARERELGFLNFSSRPGGKIAHLHHDAGALHGIEREDIRRNFCDKRISGQCGDLVFARASIPAEQVGNCDLQCGSQACERRQRRRRFFIFNFRYVGARYLHASGQLALTQSRAVAQRTNSQRNLDLRSGRVVDFGDDFRSDDYWLRLVIQRRSAAAAVVVNGSKLNEMTMVASHHLSGINRCERCGHQVWELPERGTLKQKPDSGGSSPSSTMVFAAGLKLRIQAIATLRYSGVEVKRKPYEKPDKQSKNTGETGEKTGK